MAQDGSTPLYIACEKGHLPVVEYLCGVPDIDVNKASNVREGECVCVKVG